MPSDATDIPRRARDPRIEVPLHAGREIHERVAGPSIGGSSRRWKIPPSIHQLVYPARVEARSRKAHAAVTVLVLAGALATALVAASCSGDDDARGGVPTGDGGAGDGGAGGDGGGAGEPPGCTAKATGPIDGFVLALAEGRCQRALRCAFGDRTTELDCQPCAVANGAELTNAVDGVAAGRVQFHEDVAAACLAALPGWACEVDRRVAIPEACERVFTGTVGDKGACYGLYDCAAGFACEQFGGGCPHECLPLQPAGSNCSIAKCQPGLTCLKKPESCGAGGCLQPTSVCGTPQPVGQTCSSRADCEEGLGCVPRSDCPAAFCPATCQPLVGEGSECRVSEQCPGGSYCSPETSRCVPRGRPGEACSTRRPCEASLACVVPADADTGTCTAARGAGEPCIAGEHTTSPSGCRPGLNCVDGACARPPAIGDPCAEGKQILHPCDPLVAWCSGGSCVAKIDNGARCSSSHHEGCWGGGCNGTCRPPPCVAQ
jgi:hypothetical protein